MKTHLHRKLARAADKATLRRILARREAYTAKTTREYRELVGEAVLGMGAESRHYQESMKRRRATKH